MRAVPPTPYDYASANDYYEAVDEYQIMTSSERLAEADDLAYELYRDQLLNKQG